MLLVAGLLFACTWLACADDVCGDKGFHDVRVRVCNTFFGFEVDLAKAVMYCGVPCGIRRTSEIQARPNFMLLLRDVSGRGFGNIHH